MKGFDYNRLRDNVLPGKAPEEVFQSSVVWGICWAIIPHMISFYTKYVDAWKTVKYFRTGKGATENFLSEDIVHMLRYYEELGYMPSFGTLLAGAYSGVIIYAVYRLIRAYLDQSYFVRDSKSIYVMKRLDEKSPIAKRCWSRAIAGIGACIIAAAVMTLIDFLVYRIITPGDYLIPGGAL